MSLNKLARRIHSISPREVRLTLEDGTVGVFRLNGTQFFQDEFQGEGVRVDADTDAAYRFVTSEDNESVLVGRQAPDEDGWSMLGAVVEAERAESEESVEESA